MSVMVKVKQASRRTISPPKSGLVLRLKQLSAWLTCLAEYTRKAGHAGAGESIEEVTAGRSVKARVGSTLIDLCGMDSLLSYPVALNK
jgi:hypothetical protein